MPVSVSMFGRLGDHELVRVVLSNHAGDRVTLLNYGAIVMSWITPDRAGRPGNIVLGRAGPMDYVRSNPPYLGAVCGRVANRIAGGAFMLDGRSYTLAVNNGPNHLHGGTRGFDKRVWDIPGRVNARENSLGLRLVSEEGDQGYPGKLTVQLRYTLGEDHRLTLDYEARCDRPTPINLTNHTYFNLDQGTAPTALDHRLTIRAARYLPADPHALATGEIRSVRGSAWDFTRPDTLRARQESLPTGFDNAFVLDAPGLDDWCIRAEAPRSGRILEMRTTEPAVHLYTGHYLQGEIGGDGRPMPSYAGFALEAEHYPDSIHHPEFPNAVLRPGNTYRQTTEYRICFA